MSVKTFAAIDVGSYELCMKIFELSGKNKMKEIDCIKQSLDLGSGTYATGKISNEKMDELCRVLKEFAAIKDAYKADTYKAYATSAFREAENSVIILDQIKQRTGIQVGVLSNSEQRFLTYKSIASKGEAFRKVIEGKTAIVDIGGGSIQLSLFDKDTLVSTQNLRIGVLRIMEMMQHVNFKRAQAEGLIDELVTAQLSTYKKLYLKDQEIENIIIADDYLSPWAVKSVKTGRLQSVVKLSETEELMQILRTNSNTYIANAMEITEEKVPLVLISAVMTRRIASLMGAEYIWAPGVTLCDGITYEYAEQINMFRGEHDFEEDIVACAINISKRYMGSKKRSETLENITTTIFDSMKKVHGLGEREKLYLRLAAILHDCGKYISLVNIGETSYNIIMATEIIGLSHVERAIVANIVRYNHSNFDYFTQEGTTELNKEYYLIVAKLTAILRLANSLDRSHNQKLKGIKAKLKENELILQADTSADITLEKGFFEATEEFFVEVFSVTPVLMQHKRF
ncbi:MAG: HD domain-containing protein [Lachnospiraceae bacterium]|nr:HD domain-containing protein [Lachnospiraceae bacterium]